MNPRSWVVTVQCGVLQFFVCHPHVRTAHMSDSRAGGTEFYLQDPTPTAVTGASNGSLLALPRGPCARIYLGVGFFK